MIDIASLKELIKGDVDKICEVLEESDFYDVQPMSCGNEVRCAVRDGGSLRVRVEIDTLASVIYGDDTTGDIITLVQEQMALDLRDAMTHICSILGVTDGDLEQFKPKTNPFGEFFDKVENDFYSVESEKMTILDEEDVYSRFLIAPSYMFYKDGVSCKQQERFKIAYDYSSDRICIPYRDSMGRLVGVEGRLNKEDIESGEFKYMPIYKYPKAQVVFGYYENYRTLVERRVVVVLESAKSVMKMADMGYNFAISVGKSHISDYQANLIRALNPKLVIIAFDEDVEEAQLMLMANKLKTQTPYTMFSVGYVKDRDGVILKEGSKNSPADMGKEKFDKLMKEMVHFV